MTADTRVLIVDDEPVIIAGAERVLNKEGFLAEGALGGKAAMHKIEQSNYDLVLTDLNMPEINGVSLIKWIRETQPTMGIVVITGYQSQESRKETLDLGVLDYIPKPYTPEVLKNVAYRAIDRQVLEIKAGGKFDPELLSELDKVISHYTKRAGSTIPVMQRAQELVGYLPPEIQERIANGLNISTAEIDSIVSFYSFFSAKPKGKYNIRICLGTACYVKRAEEIVKKLKDELKIDIGEVTPDMMFSLERVSCLGACGSAPVVVVGDDTFCDANPVNTHAMLDTLKNGGVDVQANA
jgi:NADH-quinone oxidoreductase subunit E/NADP-reducing hydrogenase subunit HndA